MEQNKFTQKVELLIISEQEFVFRESTRLVVSVRGNRQRQDLFFEEFLIEVLVEFIFIVVFGVFKVTRIGTKFVF